jgi:hypothetical protein
MARLRPKQRKRQLMSERDEQAEQAGLDRRIDQAVDEFLLVPDDKILDRVKELTGTKVSVAKNFDRLMAPILDEYKSQEGELRTNAAASLTPGGWRFLAWERTNSLVGTFSARPMRSVIASLVFIVVGATLSVPLWRMALRPESTNVDSNQNHPSRGAARDAPGQQPVRPGTGGNTVYMAQLVKGLSFSRTAEALDRINARYPSLFKERSLVIRRASSDEDSSAYIGGVGGLRSERDAEQICNKIRAGGDSCRVVNVPDE